MGLIKSIWDGYVKVDEFVSDLIDSTADHVDHKIGEFLWGDNNEDDESVEGIDVDYIQDLIEKDEYDSIINYCSDYCDAEDPLLVIRAYFFRAIAYCSKAESLLLSLNDSQRDESNLAEIRYIFEKSLSDVEMSLRISLESGIDSYLGYAFGIKATVLQHLDRDEDARRWRILEMSSANPELRSFAKKKYEELTNIILCKFSGGALIPETHIIDKTTLQPDNLKFCNLYSFGERQFIFIVKNIDKIAGCFDDDEIINWVFTLDRIPDGLVFPTGHPQANTLYVAHPVQKGLYLPYEGSEETVFHEKVEEFCRLAQCLGATKISFSSIKGESISKSFTSKLNAGGGIGIKGYAVGGEYTQDRTGSSASELHKDIGYSYTLQPKKVYVPTDMKWLDVDKSWQGFVKQRMEGNILSYTKRISSSEAINISNSLQKSAKASFEYLMANVNANFSSEQDSTFSHNKSSEWEIQIQFASLEELDVIDSHSDDKAKPIKQIEQPPSTSLSDAEEKYKEEVLFILEDGLISDTERRFLERKRLKLGLSEEQAARVESMCFPSLTDAEKEYMEFYKEIVGEDEVTERKRRMLNREADSLGITQERALQLETLKNN